MPHFSDRVKGTFASPFRKFLPLAEQAKKRGVEIVHLNIGQPDFDMPDQSLLPIQQYEGNFVPYGSAEGEFDVRKAWCEYYKKFDISISPEDLLITTGASEGILFTLLSISDPGDEIIVPEPFYANYNGFCQMAGVNIKPLFTSIEDGFPIPDPAVFADAITSKTKAILISTPNNPSGKVYSKQSLESLLKLAQDNDLFLLVDEAYSEFVYAPFDFHSALTLQGGDEHVVVIDSVSKRFNACGIRVGAVATRNKSLLKQMAKYARLRLSPPVLGQMYAQRALTLPQDYHHRLLEDFTARRATLLHRLSSMPGVTFHEPEGAFYIFVKLPIDHSDKFCAWLLTDFSNNGRTVMLSPGTGFYATPHKGEDEVRIAYMVCQQDINMAMDCLEAALMVYPGRSPVPAAMAVN